MKASILTLPGDGIGPEVTRAAVAVLRAVATRFGHEFLFTHGDIGGCAIDRHGDPLPPQTRSLLAGCDAVMLGAVGGPQWSDPTSAIRPEQGLLGLRKEMGVFANLRPVVPHPAARAASPLRPELLDNVDIMVVREQTGGIYFGEKRREADWASDECRYTVQEIERAVWLACMLAQERQGRVTSVDKANVLETSRLWRETAQRVVKEQFPDIELEHLLVDAAAMHLLARPSSFDVIVTENMFGDILTDEASMLVGSLGLLPSASLSGGGPGLYEPIHGSAPDIAGQGKANPVGAILSAAMLLRHSLRLHAEAAAIESAVDAVLTAGPLTPDLCPADVTPATTEMVTRNIVAQVAEAAAPSPSKETK